MLLLIDNQREAVQVLSTTDPHGHPLSTDITKKHYRTAYKILYETSKREALIQAMLLQGTYIMKASISNWFHTQRERERDQRPREACGNLNPMKTDLPRAAHYLHEPL